MKNLNYILLAVLFGAGLVACDSSLKSLGEEDVLGINVPYNFDFATTQAVNFTVKAASQNAADLSGGKIHVFNAHPDQGGKRLATYFLNDSGELAIRHSLPTHLQSVYILADSPAAEPVQVQVRNGAVQFEYNLPVTAGRGIDAGDDSFSAGLMDDPINTVRNYFPAEGEFGTIMFEDLWPSFGDYDMNDLVVGYQFSELTDVNNDILSVDMTFQIRATGTAVRAGFGIQFDDLVPANIASVDGTRLSGDTFIILDGNGTEAAQSRAVVIAFDDANENFPRMGNVFEGRNPRNPDLVSLTVTFAQPVDRDDLGSAPYNPFAFFYGTKNVVDENGEFVRDENNDIVTVEFGGRGNEVHLPFNIPTDLVDASLFNNFEDNSAEAGWYKSTDVARVGKNMNFAIAVPELVPHAIQSRRFASALVDTTTGDALEAHAFLRFAAWAESNGTVNQDWYMDNPGNRDESQLIILPDLLDPDPLD